MMLDLSGNGSSLVEHVYTSIFLECEKVRNGTPHRANAQEKRSSNTIMDAGHGWGIRNRACQCSTYPAILVHTVQDVTRCPV